MGPLKGVPKLNEIQNQSREAEMAIESNLNEKQPIDHRNGKNSTHDERDVSNGVELLSGRCTFRSVSRGEDDAAERERNVRNVACPMTVCKS